MMQNPHYDILTDKGPKGDKGDPGPAGTLTSPTTDVSFGNHRITNLGAPRDGADAVNKNYTDSTFFRRGGNINMNSKVIIDLGNPLNNDDAVSRNYGDNRYLRETQNLNLGSYWITSSHAPNTPIDLTNKAYVDKLRLKINTHIRTFNPAWRLTTTTVSQTHNLSVNDPKYFCCVIARSANESRRQAIMLPDITNDTFLVNLGGGASFTITLVNTHIYATLSGTVGVEITEFRIYY